jgi:hypothetical protein
MMEDDRWSGPQALEWMRGLSEPLEQFRFWQAVDEYGREGPRGSQTETVPAQLRPEPRVFVQQVSESSAEQPGGGSAHQTAAEILAETLRRCIECQRLSQIDIFSMRCGVFGQ